MQIGMIGAWNTDSGASIHAELVGRGWVELGHTLKVFTFLKESFHGTVITGEDDDFVVRCFSTSRATPQTLDPVPLLTSDYQFFVAQDIGMIPKDLLGKIFTRIKKKAKTINVIHDGKLAPDPSFYQFDWDGIVCFDERYADFLKKAYSEDKIFMIPYPCYPWKPGNKEASRKKLNLPKDEKIIFLFGLASVLGADAFPALKSLEKKHSLKILVVTTYPPSLEKWKKIAEENSFVELREKVLNMDELYSYLYASDLFFYHKPSLPWVAVSSTAYQVLGSGCPMVAWHSNFVEKFGKAIMTYKDEKGMITNIKSVFEKDEKYRELLKEQKRYVEENSGIRIAEKFIELFKKLSSK
jgi:hypothetical protein